MSLHPTLDIVRLGIEGRRAETGEYPDEWHVPAELYARLEDEGRTICTRQGPSQPHMTICGVNIIRMREGSGK